MRRGGRVLILLGVTLALAAAVLAIFAFRDTDDTEEPDEQDVAMVSVVEATGDISSNQVITEDDVHVVEVAEDTVAPNTARSPGQVIGLAASGEIVSGQRVLMANLVTPGLSHLVGEGMRAVAVPVDRINALGGMIRPDDRIDVIHSTRLNLEHVLPTEPIEVTDATSGYADDETLVLPPPGETGERYPYPGEPGSRFLVHDIEDGEPVTKIVLQNIRVVRVIAGDVSVGSDETNATGVEEVDQEEGDDDTGNEDEATPDRLPNADLLVLELSAENAELMKFLVDNSGQFQVALRPSNDDEVVESPGMTYHQLVEEHGLPVPRSVRLP